MEDFASDGIADTFAHYDDLYRPLVDAFGPLDDTVWSAAFPFFVGGDVSLNMRQSDGLYVTYDLTQEPDQTPSREGLRYEVFLIGAPSCDMAHGLLNALAHRYFAEEICDGMVVPLAELGVEIDGADHVSLSRFSEGPDGMGLYQATLCPPRPA